ncbi:MAG: hypothetical protein AAFO28_02990 [Pseudomonadota bacterium]
MRPLIGFSALTAAMMTALAAPTSAQETTKSVDQLVRTAVLDLCPNLMRIETPLGEERGVQALGPLTVTERTHGRFGKLDFALVEGQDGDIAIANSRNVSFCQVTFEDGASDDLLDDLMKGANLLDPSLAIDEEETVTSATYNVTTFRSPSTDGWFFGIQFISVKGGPDGSAQIIQQYLLED